MDLSGSLNNFGLLLKAQGKMAEAEAKFREALDLSWSLQKDHPFVAIQLKNLAEVLEAKGETAEAEALRREVLAIQTKKSQTGSPP